MEPIIVRFFGIFFLFFQFSSVVGNAISSAGKNSLQQGNLGPTSIPINFVLAFYYSTQTLYTEAKVDVTQEIEQRAQQAAQAGADHCALCSISCVTSTLASV